MATQQGYGPGTPAFDNLHPQMQQIALKIIAESGGRVWIGSGYRSIQEQTDLYQRWITGQYDVPSVAKPGKSKHNHGLAIDFGGDLRLAQQLGRKYGLVFNVPGEAWHGELSGAANPDGAHDFDNLQLGADSDPEQVLRDRMSTIMSVIGNLTGGPIQAQAGLGDEVFQDEFGIMGEEPNLVEFDVDAVLGQDYDFERGGERTKFPIRAADPESYGKYAYAQFRKYGFDEKDFPAIIELWNRESGDPKAGASKITWNPLAANPSSSAFGIAQFLNSTWSTVGGRRTVNPQQQIDYGLKYIKQRYGNPRNALAFHNRNNWY